MLNAADEVAVGAFLESKIPFTAIAKVAEETLGRVPKSTAASIHEVLEIDSEARRVARHFVAECAVKVAS